MAGRRVAVGRIAGLHGVRGALRLESWTQPRTRIFDYGPWTLTTTAEAELVFANVRGRSHGKALVVALPGVEDRDRAQALLGAQIWVPRVALPGIEPGEYYWTDLEGLEVVTREGFGLGRVSHVVATGANDVLVVRNSDGRERLLPFVVDRYITQVDLDGGRITVDWDPEF